MSDLPSIVAPPKRVWIPKLERFARFYDRQFMKGGHPVRSLHLNRALPIPTLPVDWTAYNGHPLTFPMDGNDKYGDCMYAAGCHGDNTMTGMNGSESTFNLNTIVQDYLSLSRGDNGLDEGTLIGAWKRGLGGIPDANIFDACDIDVTNDQLVAQAIFLFGPVVFMLDVPDAWIQAADTDAVWTAPATADQNNGHGTLWNGIDAQFRRKVQTWGTHVWITPSGVKVCDPSGFAVASKRWFNAQGYAPNKLHYTQLADYWTQMGGSPWPASPYPAPGPTPPPGPGPTPVPTPTPVKVPTLAQVQACNHDVFLKLHSVFSRIRGANTTLSAAETMLNNEHAALFQ